jgi:hypothetical protein
MAKRSLSLSPTTVTDRAPASTVFARSAVSTQWRDSRSDRAGASAQRRDLAVPVPYLTANETEAGAAVGVHRQHRVHQQAVNVAVADLAEAAAAFRAGPELDRAAVMDRQHVPALGGRAGVLAPAFDDSVHLDLWIGEEPASGFLAAPVPPSRFRQTVSRAAICSRISPPFGRGADPRMSRPTSSSAAPVLRLPRRRESYRN